MLALVVAGQRNQEIADRLVISQATVKYHVQRLFSKVGVNTRTELVAAALQPPGGVKEILKWPSHRTQRSRSMIWSSSGPPPVESKPSRSWCLCCPPNSRCRSWLRNTSIPARPSHLAEILGRRTTLPVQTVAEGEAQLLTPGVVYVVPPNQDVEIADDAVSARMGTAGHPMPSVDRLLTSAAEACGERLIAVILTGSGSDGAVGAQAVKAAGGTVVIEDPETASYPSMPASLASSTVDLVAPLTRLGALLGELVAGDYAPAEPEDEAPLAALLAQVHDQSGIDFAQYKRPTILRRLQRRHGCHREP